MPTSARSKTTKKKPRNRKAQDSTLINLDALKKRVENLEGQKRMTWTLVGRIARRLTTVEQQIVKVGK